jgi:hypothetical protein
VYCDKSFYFLLFWEKEHCGSYKSSYSISHMSYLHSLTPSFSFIPPFLEWFQQVTFFLIHTCVQRICTIFTLPCPFPTSSPLLLVPTHSGTVYSALLLSYFVNEKKWPFCLFKIHIQGLSLLHLHIYMYYNQNWFISSIFLLSTLVPFSW